jgi:hypothetical protein
MKRLPLPLAIILGIALLTMAASRPPDIAFRMHTINPGWCETVAIGDFNRDGRPDIASCESWYAAPNWSRHPLREINYTNGYIDNFSDLPVDVDGDGYTDLIQIEYFNRRLLWLKNPGKAGGAWVESEIDRIGPTEFAFLVDLDNDGKANELLPQFTGAAASGLAWYEFRDSKWVKHVVSAGGYGHGIGVGDINNDGRNDILTPRGWLEGPVEVRAPGNWAFHATDWNQLQIPVGAAVSAGAPPVNARPVGEFGFMYVLDINKDGRNDILTTMAHSYGVLWIEQGAGGQWTQRLIDNTWSQAHASALVDLNGDGQPDVVTGKRYSARNAPDPAEREPLGLYWYEFRPLSAREGPSGIEWIRHLIDYGGRAGGGLQISVRDMDGDGDVDVVSAGKSGLFLAENLTKGTRSARK